MMIKYSKVGNYEEDSRGCDDPELVS